MKISNLRIENYRTFEDETVYFDDYTCVVGPNGSGKSSILSALNILFRNTEAPTDISYLHEEDFHHRNISDPIRITATFEDLSDAAKKALKAYVRQDKLIFSAIAKWDADFSRAEVRQVGSRLIIKEFAPYFKSFDEGAKADQLKAIYATIRTSFPDLQDVKTKDGMRQALRDFEEAHPERCELVESSDQFYGWTKGSNRLENHLQWVYVPAVKDPTEEQDEARNTALGKLLQRTIRARVDFSEPLKELRTEMASKYQGLLAKEQGVLVEVADSLQRRLQEWSHPGARVELVWHYDDQRSVTVTDPTARAKVGEGVFLGDLVRLGHGIQRCFLVIILQELVSSNVEGQPTLILAIEEPELYQHPPQARHLASVLEALPQENAQVLITTHSPYFISGRGFENVRMTRKTTVEGKTRVTQFTHKELSESLATALNEAPRTPTAILAAVEQIMQPSQNELFFSRVPVLVEGTEDIAFISTHLRLSQLWQSFRRYGCHFVVCGGKNAMSRPLAIARGLKIPFFAIFDGDVHQCSDPAKHKQHERDNGCLLSLCGDLSPPLSENTIWGKNYVMWFRKIFDEVRHDFGPSDWDASEAEARVRTGLKEDIKRKHPLLVSATLEVLWEKEFRSTLLDRLCKSMLEYAEVVDQQEGSGSRLR